jgi:hypothetical protein
MKIRGTPFHFVTALLGLLFTLTVLLPHILQRFDVQYPFRGIEIMPGDQEQYYAARVREVMDGFSGGGNTFYSSPKDQPAMQPALAEWCIAQMARLFGLDAMPAFVLAKGILAFGLVLAMVSFFTLATGKKWESLLTVTILLFAGSALHAPWNLPGFLFSSLSLDTLRFARLVHPLWSALWFFAALAALASWLRERGVRKILFMIFSFAMMLYSYVYAWTYFGALLGFLFLWTCVRRDAARVRDLLLLTAGITIFGIPYLLHTWVLIHHPWYADTAARLGLVHLRTPVFGVWAAVFLFLSPFANRAWRETAPLFPLLALSGILALNQQIITGIFLVPHHYHWYFLQPLAAGMLLLLVFSAVSTALHSPRVRQGATGVLLLGAISFGMVQQARAYREVRALWGSRQEYAPILAFLRERTQPGVVTYGTKPESLSEMIPIYTSADLYSAGNANASLTPMERARETLFFALWLRGVLPEEAKQKFLSDLRAEVSSRIYGIYYRELMGQYTAIPDALLEEHARVYEQYFHLSQNEKLSLYPLHYLVIEPQTPQTDALTMLEREGGIVFDEGGYRVFSLPERADLAHEAFGSTRVSAGSLR